LIVANKKLLTRLASLASVVVMVPFIKLPEISALREPPISCQSLRVMEETVMHCNVTLLIVLMILTPLQEPSQDVDQISHYTAH